MNTDGTERIDPDLRLADELQKWSAEYGCPCSDDKDLCFIHNREAIKELCSRLADRVRRLEREVDRLTLCR